VQLSHRRLRQRLMRQVRRVKRTAHHTNAPGDWFRCQTQSLRTRNWLYSAASGVPGSGLCW
jgi:hypothetical protein